VAAGGVVAFLVLVPVVVLGRGGALFVAGGHAGGGGRRTQSSGEAETLDAIVWWVWEVTIFFRLFLELTIFTNRLFEAVRLRRLWLGHRLPV
jgi:preprotein translocase subunit SecG